MNFKVAVFTVSEKASNIPDTSFDFREIMHEIQRLRIEQEIHAKNTAEAQYNPTLMAELRLLRQRKDELENRMQALQESRKDLVMQLESLMKLLKVLLFTRRRSR